MLLRQQDARDVLSGQKIWIVSLGGLLQIFLLSVSKYKNEHLIVVIKNLVHDKNYKQLNINLIC